ncbi:MAG: exo-alpha-sialidase [Mariniblastus sp.]
MQELASRIPVVTFGRSIAIFCFCLSISPWGATTAQDKQAAEKQNSVALDSGNLKTSFESSQPGLFRELETTIGVWKNVVGQVRVDDAHAKSGTRCLQLAGGKQSSVELFVGDRLRPGSRLSFWSERWTTRKPFSFRIEKQTTDSKEKWIEILNGDEQIRVGRAFLSKVSIPLGVGKIERLRFSVQSPASTGILIDDISFLPPQPQKIKSVEAIPFALPALVGNPHVALVKLKIETSGWLAPISIEEIVGDLKGTTDVSCFSQIGIIKAGKNFDAKSKKSLPAKIENPKSVASFSITGESIELDEGTNYLWLVGKLKPNTNIDHFVGARISKVTFSNSNEIKIDAPRSIQRTGVALRQSGDDNVHTYRIPGLATTNKGTLIGVYDVRYDGGKDLPGNIDVGMSRSTDGGNSWQPMKVIMDMGNNAKWNGDGIGDPSILVDSETGTIWVSATWSHGNRSWNGSGPGLTPEETGQWMLTKSDDDGLTWSKPINITEQVKKPEWCFLLQGPGKGITMADGTLVFPAQYQDPPNKTDEIANRLPHSTFIYSRDHGKSWATGTGAWDDTTESQIVELSDGELMLNCRFNRASNRVVMTTADMGKTWAKHLTSQEALIEPRACMASLINVGRELSKRKLKGFDNNFLLFSNPESLSGRNHITIKASKDSGESWPGVHSLLLDEQNSRGYSCLSMIDSETVGILYEGSQSDLTFQRVKIKDILSPPSEQKTRNDAISSSRSTGSTSATGSIRYKTPSPKPTAVSVSFGKPFGNHMVLQADRNINVWGTAQPNSNVKIGFGISNQNNELEIYRTQADADGKWSTQLAKKTASSTAHTLTVNSKGTTATIEDILIGEVWICAGQSNMEWPLVKSESAENEIANSNDSLLRIFNSRGSPRGGAGEYSRGQLDRLTSHDFSSGRWEVASPKTTAQFSAVAYYFAKQLRNKIHVPIGVINLSVGGTPIESWISQSKLKNHSELSKLLDGNWLNNENLDQWCRERANSNLRRVLSGELETHGDEFGPNHSFKPSYMYAACIDSFSNLSLGGAIWYQGESNADNADRAKVYDQCFPLLVEQFREHFPNENLPIAFVQLPAMGRKNWPIFREYQRRSLQKLTNVGMAITIDTGHPTNVHPPEKKVVGERLAQWAIVSAYHQPGIAMGPLLKSYSIKDNSVEVNFDYTGDGLISKGNANLNHFEVAGSDGSYFPANATIEDSKIRLSSPDVARPKHVRYAWAAFPSPRPNLYNSAGLPASPFSTQGKIPSQMD